MFVSKNINCYKMQIMDSFLLLRCLQEHMDILPQTIISEFSIKAPKDPKNPL